MRIKATALSVSWIPSESISGVMRSSFDRGVTHYDPPPPDHVAGAAGAHQLRAEDRLRFANVVSAWADVVDGRIEDAGWNDDSGLVMGTTTVRLARLGVTFRNFSLPVLQQEPRVESDRVTFTQTVGGRTALPAPRPVPHKPFVQWRSPTVWTTLTLTLHADGSADVAMPGASHFPRHWVYGPDGGLRLKSGLTDLGRWVAHSFGARTPWGDEDSASLVTAVETQLERQLASELMRQGRRPEVRRVPAGTTVTRQGDPGDELYLLLDGVMQVIVDDDVVADVGPGAVLGERALLEGGRRTATLVAVTPVRLAVSPRDAVDVDRLKALADLHRREDDRQP
jgi:Cyclic nucleotide-binding domain